MDNLPTASPDGKWLAYFAMKRPGYEADRQVLMLRDLATGQVARADRGWDRSVGSIAWAPDGKTIYVTAEDTQENPIFGVDPTSGKVDAADAGRRGLRGGADRRRVWCSCDEQPDRARRFLPADGQEDRRG